MTVVNEEGNVEKAAKFSSSSIYMKMLIDPETKVIKIDYYTLYNFLIAVGGLSESITLLCMIFMPVLFVIFLRKLASIIQQKKLEDYKKSVI